MVKFKASVGRQRITGSMNPTDASYTRTIRDQMKAIEKNVEAFVNTVRNVTPEVLIKALKPSFEKSQKYVPVDTGDLKGSGYLRAEAKGKVVKAEIGYGKAGDPFYAAYVHERTDLNHAAPTRSKYLQAPLQEDMPKLSGRLVKAYREITGIK